MDFVLRLAQNALSQTLVSLSHNWPFLLASTIIAGILKVFVDAQKVSAFLNRFKGASVLAATVAAVATPLCSCGTTAVVLGMMASTMPWAPIVAFMVASPLSSPEGMLYSAGLFGWPFAVYYFVASIALGLASGVLAVILQKAGFLEGQARFTQAAPVEALKAVPALVTTCDCSLPASPAEAARSGSRFSPIAARSPLAPLAVAASPVAFASSAGGFDCGATIPSASYADGDDVSDHGAPPSGELLARASALGRAVLDVSKTILPMFLGFAFLGYLLNGLIPAGAISALFGSGRAYGVPLAATIGLPLYVNSETSMPLVRALLDSGMSQGSIMAFLIAGSGTSIGAIGGALTIARWKVVGLVVGVLWAGAIVVGDPDEFIQPVGAVIVADAMRVWRETEHPIRYILIIKRVRASGGERGSY